MDPIYIPRFVDPGPVTGALIHDSPWEQRTDTRLECFMSEGGGVSYTYGSGRGVRTYTSVDMTFSVWTVLQHVNVEMDMRGWKHLNGCFLNRYDGAGHHLGWHADNFEKMDHTCPVAVVSFGEEREIWWRRVGEEGVVPSSQRQPLGAGSLFIMPPGFQQTHQHRIPKGDRQMGTRVSLTFRRFLD